MNSKQLNSREIQRVDWVDVAKYICIIAVMGSHLECRTEVLKTLYSPFFLTVFFFCSGYVYKHKDGFRIHLRKKIQQLFIPWFVFSVFNILLSQILSFNEQKDLETELFWNFMQIRGKGDGIWFVAALFITYIPFYFFVRWFVSKECSIKRITMAIGISLGLSFVSVIYSKFANPFFFPWNSTSLPWHLEYIFQGMFYMVLGYLFKTEFEETFNRYNSIFVKVILWVSYLLIIFIPYMLNLEFEPLFKIGFDYICQIIGVFSVICLSKLIRPSKYMLYVGQNTLICFAFHGKIYSLIQTMLGKFAKDTYKTILSNTVTSTIFCILFAIMLSIILLVPIYIINQFLPFLLGRRTKNS